MNKVGILEAPDSETPDKNSNEETQRELLS